MTKKELMAFRKRRTEMGRLKQKGWSLEKIAQKYGISKQRVYQIFLKISKDLTE